MKKWKLIAGVLLVFVCGVLAGSLGTGFYHQYLSGKFGKDPAARKAFILHKLTERLDLTAEQQATFKTIIDQVDAQRRSEMTRYRAEWEKIKNEGAEQMKKVLNADQRMAFDAFLKEIRDRRKNRSAADR